MYICICIYLNNIYLNNIYLNNIYLNNIYINNIYLNILKQKNKKRRELFVLFHSFF